MIYETGGGPGFTHLTYDALQGQRITNLDRSLNWKTAGQIADLEQEQRQTRVQERQETIEVIVGREDFPAQKATIRIDFYPSSSQEMWGKFVADVTKALHVDFIYNIIQKSDKAPVFRILMLKNGAEYLVRQRETSAVLEILANNVPPVEISWEITRDIINVKRDLAFNMRQHPQTKERVHKLVSRKLTKGIEKDVAQRLLVSTKPEDVVRIIHQLYLPDTDPESVEFKTDAMMLDYSVNDRFNNVLDIITLHRLALEQLDRLTQRGNGDQVVKNAFPYVLKVTRQLMIETDICAVSLQLIADNAVRLSKTRDGIFNVVLDCIQKHAPLPPAHRPRRAKRIVDQQYAAQQMKTTLEYNFSNLPTTINPRGESSGAVPGAKDVDLFALSRYGEFYATDPDRSHHRKVTNSALSLARRVDFDPDTLEPITPRSAARRREEAARKAEEEKRLAAEKKRAEEIRRQIEIENANQPKVILNTRDRVDGSRQRAALKSAMEYDGTGPRPTSGQQEGESNSRVRRSSGRSRTESNSSQRSQDQDSHASSNGNSRPTSGTNRGMLPPLTRGSIVSPTALLQQPVKKKYQFRIKEKDDSSADPSSAEGNSSSIQWSGTKGEVGKRFDPIAAALAAAKAPKPGGVNREEVNFKLGAVATQTEVLNAQLQARDGENDGEGGDKKKKKRKDSQTEEDDEDEGEDNDEDDEDRVTELANRRGSMGSLASVDEDADIAAAASAFVSGGGGAGGGNQPPGWMPSISTLIKRANKVRFVKQPLPEVDIPIFRGFAHQMPANVVLPQAMGTILQMLLVNYGNREWAFQQELLIEIAEVTLDCAALPRVLEYFVEMVETLYREGLGDPADPMTAEHEWLEVRSMDDPTMVLSASSVISHDASHAQSSAAAPFSIIEAMSEMSVPSIDANVVWVEDKFAPPTAAPAAAATAEQTADSDKKKGAKGRRETVRKKDEGPDAIVIQHITNRDSPRSLRARDGDQQGDEEQEAELAQQQQQNAGNNIANAKGKGPSAPPPSEHIPIPFLPPSLQPPRRGSTLPVDQTAVGNDLEAAAVTALAAAGDTALAPPLNAAKEEELKRLHSPPRRRQSQILLKPPQATLIPGVPTQYVAEGGTKQVQSRSSGVSGNQLSSTNAQQSGYREYAASQLRSSNQVGAVASKPPGSMASFPRNPQLVQQIGITTFDLRYRTSPGDVVLTALAMAAAHIEVAMYERDLAKFWLEYWADGSREYYLLVLKGRNLTGM